MVGCPSHFVLVTYEQAIFGEVFSLLGVCVERNAWTSRGLKDVELHWEKYENLWLSTLEGFVFVCDKTVDFHSFIGIELGDDLSSTAQ